MKRLALLVLVFALAFTGIVCAEDDIRIGIYAPLSGDSAMVGKSLVDGAMLAIEEFNAAGGIDAARPAEEGPFALWCRNARKEYHQNWLDSTRRKIGHESNDDQRMDVWSERMRHRQKRCAKHYGGQKQFRVVFVAEASNGDAS